MTGSEIRQTMISAREEYIGIIRDELLGPGSEFSLPDREHELISSTPTSRYSVGILFPQGNAVNQDNDETVELEESDNSAENSGSVSVEDPGADPVQQKKQRTYAFDETADENLDEEIGMATQYMPSSMGITFIASGNTNIVRGSLTFATYRNAKVPDCMIPYLPDTPDTYTVPPELAHIMVYDKDTHALRLISSVTVKEARSIFERDTIPENEFHILQKIVYRFVDYCAMGYVRVPHEIPEFVLDFSHGDYADDEANHNLDGTDAKLVALRRKIGDNLWSITVMLVNDRKESPVKANRCIFQAKMKVSSENNDFFFCRKQSQCGCNRNGFRRTIAGFVVPSQKNIRNRLGYIRRLGNRCVWSWGYMERFLTDNRDSVDEFFLASERPHQRRRIVHEVFVRPGSIRQNYQTCIHAEPGRPV